MSSFRLILTTAVLAGFTTIASAVPPPSPGIQVGKTAYEPQGPGRHTARVSGADIVHFSWLAMEHITTHPDDPVDRRPCYNAYLVSTGVLTQGLSGCCPPGCLSCCMIPFITGPTELAVGGGNEAHVVTHMAEDVSLPYQPWHMGYPIPGNSLHVDEQLSGYPPGTCQQALWPRVAASRDVYSAHVVAHSDVSSCATDLLFYWRYNGTDWTGPIVIDSTSYLTYLVCDDPGGDKLAVVVNRSNLSSGYADVEYYESSTDGAGWIDGSETRIGMPVSNYADPLGPQAWLDLSAAYDNAGVLHISWSEQTRANETPQTILRHWNSLTGVIRPITTALWVPRGRAGTFNLNLSNVAIGVGDGSTICGGQSNVDYLYVVYSHFGGYALPDQADTSLSGFYNGEIYLNVSNDGGSTWSPPANLTNTRTPDCYPGPPDTLAGEPRFPDNVCRSESWASIGEVVSDIDILFISDLDAGAIPYGEGTWQMNSVMYLRIPGGMPDAQHLCASTGPAIGAMLSGGDSCGFHASQSGNTTGTLLLMNTGNADLSGVISLSDFPDEATLSTGAEGPFTIPAGGSDLTAVVAMASNGAAMGGYAGQIIIDHNDATIPDPLVIDVSFEVGLCQCHTDPICDGATNVQDVIEVIGRAFRGDAGSYDAVCPDDPPYIDGRTDLDCDGATSVVDVVRMVNVAFRGASAQTEFCHICQ